MPTAAGLWRDYRVPLRDYIARRVREPQAVEDILQEVLLKAHRGLAAIRSPGSVAAWLHRIAANAVVDHYRGRETLEELPEALAAPEPETDAAAELADCVPSLIEELPASYRIPLVLSEIQGLPQREVAARLGLSLSGAKSRVQRGRARLRERFLACCDIELGPGGILGYRVRDGEGRCPGA